MLSRRFVGRNDTCKIGCFCKNTKMMRKNTIKHKDLSLPHLFLLQHRYGQGHQDANHTNKSFLPSNMAKFDHLKSKLLKTHNSWSQKDHLVQIGF